MDQINFNSVGGGLVGNKICHKLFEQIISLENLFLAWREFKRGKMTKFDVREFAFNLEDNLFLLHKELKAKTYQHDKYSAFSINDPKPRQIHKATVRDRVVHQAVFRALCQIFDKHFIFDSYSCRLNKGTHAGINRLAKFLRQASKNNTQVAFILKCDVKRFFDSVSQEILLGLITKKVQDTDAVWLIKTIIQSFEKTPGKGLPLGNVTSQLFANIYLNEFDQFVKHKLRIKGYVRYCDDFVIVGNGRFQLRELVKSIGNFLGSILKLTLHPNKIVIRKQRQGIDFLGYILLPSCRVLRAKTRKRIVKKTGRLKEKLRQKFIPIKRFQQSLHSYFGLLRHCASHKIMKQLLKVMVQ